MMALRFKINTFDFFVRKFSSYKRILGIECSCDDTSVGIVSTNREILSEKTYNQFEIHKKLGAPKQNIKTGLTAWGGGVIPNIARNLHRQNLLWATSDCIKEIVNGWESIDAIALTVMPGIEPCLYEGIQFTELLLKRFKKPFIPIHHMEAHALTARLFEKELKYPFLTLLISGGHSIICLCDDYNKFERLGQATDISPGSCIDKIARSLGLFELNKNNSLSGGHLMEKYAAKGDPFSYPYLLNSMRTYYIHNRDCDFSFSGFLSSTLRLINKFSEKDMRLIEIDGVKSRFLKENIISDICASVQHSIALQLENRLKRALLFYRNKNKNIEHVVMSGGVASNLYIRSILEKSLNRLGAKLYSPPVSYCTDNGVMIAWNGCEKLLNNSQDISYPDKQNKEFFANIKPQAKCELGTDISYQIKLLNIKV